MKNQENYQHTNPTIGCLIMIVAIFLIPYLIQLLEVLVIVALVGGIGFIIFQVIQYDKKTGNVTYTIEKILNLPVSDPTRQELPEADNTKLLELMSSEKEKDALEVQQIKAEIDELKRNRESDITLAISKYADKVEIQKKKEAIQDLFSGTIDEGYKESDVFEIQQHHEQIKKKKDELDIRELKQELSEGLFEQKKDLIEHKVETREQFLSVRQEMTAGFMQIQENLKLLAQGIMNLEVYVKEKFATLEISFMRELDGLKNLLGQMHTEFKQETSEMKLRFGQEFLRIDKQQMTIVDKMRDYESNVRAFGQEMVRIKMDAEKFSMRGEQMLAKAEIAHQQHKAHIQLLSKDVSTSLERMSLKEMSFANTVGSAKNKMDEISNQQYKALKDMAYERIGINALREDYQNRVTLEQEKFNRLNDQHRSILQQIQTAKAHGRETAQLQHRLSMTQENLNYSQNQLGLYRQEMAQVKRLSN